MRQYAYQHIDPAHLAWNDDGYIRIVWSDAHESTYSMALLREQCPCATCKGTHGPPTTLVVRTSKLGVPIVSQKTPAASVASTIRRADPVGGYAIRLTWGDGHDAGLYSYRMLRSICPCPECVARGKSGATDAGAVS